MTITTKLLTIVTIFTITSQTNSMVPAAKITPLIRQLKQLAQTVPSEIVRLTNSGLRTDIKIETLHREINAHEAICDGIVKKGDYGNPELGKLHSKIMASRHELALLAVKKCDLTQQMIMLEGRLNRAIRELETELAAAQRLAPAAPVKRATPAGPAIIAKRVDIPTTGC